MEVLPVSRVSFAYRVVSLTHGFALQRKESIKSYIEVRIYGQMNLCYVKKNLLNYTVVIALTYYLLLLLIS